MIACKMAKLRSQHECSIALGVNGGVSCSTWLQPKVVTDIEDEELRTRMEELTLANQEVAGDDDQDEEDAVEEGPAD